MIFRYFYGFAVSLFSFLCSMSWRSVAVHLALFASLSCHVLMFESVSESTASATGPLPHLTRYAHVSVSERIPNDAQKLLYIVSGEDPVRSLGFELMYKMFQEQFSLSFFVLMFESVSESTASATGPLPHLTRYAHVSVSERIPNDAQKLLYIVSGEDPVRSLGFELMYKMFQEQLDDMSNACYDLEYLEEVHICMSSRVYTHVLPHVEKVYYYFNELRSDFLLDDLKLLVISMVSNIQFECCDSGLLQENWVCYCEECEHAQMQRDAISVCMHSMISDTLSELKREYDQTWSIALY